MYASELSLDLLYDYTLKRSYFLSFLSLLYGFVCILSFTVGQNSLGALYLVVFVAVCLVVWTIRYDFNVRTVNSQYIALVALSLLLLLMVSIAIYNVIVADGIVWAPVVITIIAFFALVKQFGQSFDIIRRLKQGEDPRNVDFGVTVVSPQVVHGTLSPIPVPAYAASKTSLYTAPVQVQVDGNTVPVNQVQGGGGTVPVVEARIV